MIQLLFLFNEITQIALDSSTVKFVYKCKNLSMSTSQ